MQKQRPIPFTPRNIRIDGERIKGEILSMQMTYAKPNDEHPEGINLLTVAYTTPKGNMWQYTVELDSVSVGL